MRPALMLLAIAMLSGCGYFLDGKIYSLERPRILPMSIEVTRGGGAISASDPETGEQFHGTYVGIRDSQSAVALAHTFSRGGQPSQTTVVPAMSTRSQVPAMATMIGDKGTVLDCQMLIQAGWRPRGMGTCTDNRGGRYSLQF